MLPILVEMKIILQYALMVLYDVNEVAQEFLNLTAIK